MAIIGVSVSAIFLIPALWFVHQNYEIVSNIAFKYQPSMLKELDQEITWLYIFLGLTTISMTGCLTYFTWKMTNQILRPLQAVDQHMVQLAKGDWTSSAPHSAGEDLKEFLVNYDFLYRTLKSISNDELTLLAKLRVQPTDAEAIRTWNTITNLHRQRLGLEPIDFSAKTAAPEPLRRVS